MYSLFEQTLLAYRHHFFFVRKKDKEKSLNNVYIGNITEKERAREIGKTDRHRQIDRQRHCSQGRNQRITQIWWLVSSSKSSKLSWHT